MILESSVSTKKVPCGSKNASTEQDSNTTVCKQRDQMSNFITLHKFATELKAELLSLMPSILLAEIKEATKTMTQELNSTKTDSTCSIATFDGSFSRGNTEHMEVEAFYYEIIELEMIYADGDGDFGAYTDRLGRQVYYLFSKDAEVRRMSAELTDLYAKCLAKNKKQQRRATRSRMSFIF